MSVSSQEKKATLVKEAGENQPGRLRSAGIEQCLFSLVAHLHMNLNILSSFWGLQGWLPPSFLGQKAAGKGIKTSPSFLSRKHSCENNGIIIKQNEKCPETTFLVNLVIKQNSLKGPHSWTERRTKIFGRGQRLNKTSKRINPCDVAIFIYSAAALSNDYCLNITQLKSYFSIKVRYIGVKVDIGQSAIKIYKQKPHKASRLV